ncbi:hypothetical protein CCY16_00595 [Wolbachia endosymbiont of Wuchereria bancrofti]|nr:hypothetical protein CCY16_00595 [Wolbachia endosymbiont of Wuchereria bancrofti]
MHPGLEETLAAFLLFISKLIKLDFPTFDLPANAISGTDSFGNEFMSEAPNIKLLFNVTRLTIILYRNT